MSFEPIAIISHSLILPKCSSLSDLWNILLNKKSVLSDHFGRKLPCPIDEDEYLKEFLRNDIKNIHKDPPLHMFGGFVEDSIWENKTNLIPEELWNLDPIIKWLYICAKEVFDKANDFLPTKIIKNSGIIMGNLSYPSEGLSNWLRDTLSKSNGFLNIVKDKSAEPLDRFMSGFPIQKTAQLLGLNKGGYGIDAACSSSLYALYLSCRDLQEKKCDFMISGAVNRCDPRLIYTGFSSLQALSPSKQSRPFHENADGLIPCEGAACVGLIRLEDAISNNLPIEGVIKSIAINNDGKGGLLVPQVQGQINVMKKALNDSGLKSSDIDYIECHATGTKVGDKCEVESLKSVYGNNNSIPIGSSKANFGHAITTAGMVGLLKLIASIKNKKLPPSLIDSKNCKIESPFRFIDKEESLKENKTNRFGLSAFGFGGNNAHLILEEYRKVEKPILLKKQKKNDDEIVIVKMNSVIGSHDDAEEISKILTGDKKPDSNNIKSINFEMKDIKIPPNDLKKALLQQLIILKLSCSILNNESLDPERTSSLIGMGCDTYSSNAILRWTVFYFYKKLGILENDLEDVLNSISPHVDAALTLGCMPNLISNRLNKQFDFKGPSFSISGEETSIFNTINIASDLLKTKTIDNCIVGVAETVSDIAHKEALNHINKRDSIPVESACVFLLKRKSDAIKNNDNILAILGNKGNDFNGKLVISKKNISKYLIDTHTALGAMFLMNEIFEINKDKNDSYKKISVKNMAGFDEELFLSNNSSKQVSIKDILPYNIYDEKIKTIEIKPFRTKTFDISKLIKK